MYNGQNIERMEVKIDPTKTISINLNNRNYL